jgi:hypothetical protein
VIIAVGLQADRDSEISVLEGQQFASSINAKFIEASAETSSDSDKRKSAIQTIVSRIFSF